MQKNKKNNNRYKRYRQVLCCVAALTSILIAILYIQEKKQQVPSEVSVFAGETLTLDGQRVYAFQNKETGSYEVDYKLFGLLPIKKVSVDVKEPLEIIPCGTPAGIYVETDGVLVVGSEEMTDVSGNLVNATASIVKKGDYITSVNGTEITKKAQLLEEVENCGGKPLILGIRRDGEKFEVKLQPVQCTSGSYKLGLWVRDNTQGIGMITYLTEDGAFGALGHGISDADAESMMETSRGLLYQTKILTIVKGANGVPGELVGFIDYHKNYVIGRIENNTQTGIYGTVTDSCLTQVQATPVPVCMKQDIKTGPAKIRTELDGEIREYDVNILSVSLEDAAENKGMILQATDEALLQKTGGIVQGMSGSPILQDGKIVGAVTHVFVDDPTRGYGIFIETMLEQ